MDPKVNFLQGKKHEDVRNTRRISHIFFFLAIADLSTFIFAIGQKPYLQSYELNPAFHILGLEGFSLLYLMIHFAFLDYLQKPRLRSMQANYIISFAIFMICFFHIIGTASNIYTYVYGSMKEAVYQYALTHPQSIILMPLFLMALASHYTFGIYLALDSLWEFERKSYTSEVGQIIMRHAGKSQD